MYRIGELAKQANVTPDTIRYYERTGLMPHVTRSQGGYRLYTDEDLKRLRFIRHARQLGFTLEAIHKLLFIRVNPQNHTCQQSKNIVESLLEEVALKLHELEKIHQSLKRLSDACCGDIHSSAYCSILEALEQGAST